jgi:hypothetical protein
MKYIISENRLLDMVGRIVHTVFPDFKKGHCIEMDMGDSDNPEIHYFTDKTFARLNLWSEELLLNRELFEQLERFFGEDMTLVIDWFNKEFNQNASSIAF